MSALLDIKGLTTDLHGANGQLRAVEDISLSIRPGEAVALVGESGSGKSMTALSIMQLLPPSARIVSGSVCFDGQELLGLTSRQMRGIRGSQMAMVFQDPMTFLNPLIRVGGQIYEAVRLHVRAGRAEAWSIVRDALVRVRMPDPDRVMESYPHQLSGGQRQRVLIAIAIACSPRLLICDEPTTALDVTIQAQIMDLLSTLRRETGTALLLITHDLGLVAEYCDRVYVMYAARIVEEAGVADIFAMPRHPYTRALLGSTLKLDRRATSFLTIPGQPPNLARPPSGCRFHPRCPDVFARCSQIEPAAYDTGRGRSRCLLHEAAS